MPMIPDDQREALKKKHGDLNVLTTKRMQGHEFAFRRCGVAEFDALMCTLASKDPAAKAQASRQLAVDLLVYPDAETWQKLAEDLPGLAHAFGDKLSELAGAGADIAVGKG